MCGVSLLTALVMLAILLPNISKEEPKQAAVENQVEKDTSIHDGKDYAVVNLSVCNLRQTPNFTAEMSTQARPLMIIQDGCILWVSGV